MNESNRSPQEASLEALLDLGPQDWLLEAQEALTLVKGLLQLITWLCLLVLPRAAPDTNP